MFAEILFLIVLALIISLLLGGLGRVGPGPLAGFFFFFLLFLFIGWAASMWLIPAGPATFGVHWTGPLVVTLLIALLLLAALPSTARRSGAAEERRQEMETPAQTETRHAVETGVTVLFWVVLIGLFLVTAAGYLLAD